MIEINLIPESKRRERRRKWAPGLTFGRKVPVDRWIASAGVSGLTAVGAFGWMIGTTAGQAQELGFRIESAIQDSLRLATVIERADIVSARSDSIAFRVDVIQQVDGTRYIWAHIMDEVARALPDQAWLTGIHPVGSGDPAVFRIEGRAESSLALTAFMEALETSAFVRGLRLVGSEQVLVGSAGADRRMVHGFAMEAEYRHPPVDSLKTESLMAEVALDPRLEEE